MATLPSSSLEAVAVLCINLHVSSLYKDGSRWLVNGCILHCSLVKHALASASATDQLDVSSVFLLLLMLLMPWRNWAITHHQQQASKPMPGHSR